MNQKPTCPHCGDSDVGATGITSWDVTDQKWVLDDVYDGNFYCRHCDAEFDDPEWVELSTPKAPVDNPG